MADPRQLYNYENTPEFWKTFSYSGGPTQLPRMVSHRIQREFLDYKGTGISMLETNTYSKEFHQILTKAVDDLRFLYDIPQHFKVVFCAGGGTLLFDAIPMNLLKGKSTASYVNTGYWSKRAINEANILCPNVEFPTELKKNEQGQSYVPDFEDWKISADSAYLHYCDNETVEGLEYSFTPKVPGLPLVSDMSSNFLTKAIDWTKTDLVYAHAQKNIGIAGSALMVINEKLVDNRKLSITPYMCDFEEMLRQQSMINTLPSFPIYVNSLVFDWMRQFGKVSEWEQIMTDRSKIIYDVIENSHGFYRCQVVKNWRSRINVSFDLQSKEQTEKFLTHCENNGMIELKGHRAVGGCRASLYVPVPQIAIDKLANVMEEYATQ